MKRDLTHRIALKLITAAALVGAASSASLATAATPPAPAADA